MNHVEMVITVSAQYAIAQMGRPMVVALVVPRNSIALMARKMTRVYAIKSVAKVMLALAQFAGANPLQDMYFAAWVLL
jgi:hypothetical protein